jgi:bis(5'-nucleosyl)-tetraphosphatase (symmetrical)
MGRDIVIGDVHGCLDELDELIRLVGYPEAGDRLTFVGDLVDRGPDSIGVIRRVQEMDANCVMGNHDEWYVRYAKYERAGGKNPMSKPPHKTALYALMSEGDIDYLSSLPLTYRLDENLIVVHAGLAPNVGKTFSAWVGKLLDAGAGIDKIDNMVGILEFLDETPKKRKGKKS